MAPAITLTGFLVCHFAAAVWADTFAMDFQVSPENKLFPPLIKLRRERPGYGENVPALLRREISHSFFRIDASE